MLTAGGCQKTVLLLVVGLVDLVQEIMQRVDILGP